MNFTNKITQKAALGFIIVALLSLSGVAAAGAAKYHLWNPKSNIAPEPDFLAASSCVAGTNGGYSCDNPCVTPTLTWPVFANSVGCTTFVLEAIDRARHIEGLGPMILPKNWYDLSRGEQLFVVVNLERTARGLPAYLGINTALSAEALRAAAKGDDPGLATNFLVATNPQGYPAMGAAWSGGFSALTADYIWMYDDGWAGSVSATSNIACTSPGSKGCWAHRDELLGSDPGYNPGVGLYCNNCEVGVGVTTWSGGGSWVELIEKPKNKPPAMTYTWTKVRQASKANR